MSSVLCVNTQGTAAEKLQKCRPTLLGPSSHYMGCAAQVEDMQVPRLFLHDVDFSVGSHAAQNPPASLQALEDRFAALIEPKLAAAMTQRNRERVQKLAAMLVDMARPEAVERLYNTARLAPLQVGLWSFS